jgi:hypothetical protein
MVHKTIKSFIGYTFILIMVFVVVQSCSHYDEIQQNGMESTADGDSHNAGRNCMSCHHEAGNEAYGLWWYIAGTAFKDDHHVANSGGTVELWTQPNRNGEHLYTLKIDRSGNFYTQKIINFKRGFYPVLISPNGDIKAMTTQITEGACNSCHGITENVIEID